MKTLAELETEVFDAEQKLREANTALRDAENLARNRKGQLEWAKQQVKRRIAYLTEAAS